MTPPKGQPPTKKAKLFDSRVIRTEQLDPAYKNGILSLPQFLQAREYETRAFEQSQLNTKYASSTRVFQSLPRTLRRRTASHNVKRVPRRLRARSLREMQNTVTGTPAKKAHLRGRELHRLKVRKRLLRLASKIKASRGVPAVSGGTMREKMAELNAQLDQLKSRAKPPANNAVAAVDRVATGALAAKPRGNIKYASRQKSFTWLPTHVWHAKRFHMSKKWGFQVPHSPNQKCFRSTTRAAKEAAVAFDTSYFCEAVVECRDREAAEGFFREFTRYSAKLPEWLVRGAKAYNGWIYTHGAKHALGSVFFAPAANAVLLRLHPTDYDACFGAVAAWAGSTCKVHDCRYALGSVQLRGPTALNSLAKVLHVEAEAPVKELWTAHCLSRDPQLVPEGTAFAFFAKDPRFWKHAVSPPPGKMSLNEALLAKAPAVDPAAVAALLSSEGRTDSYKNMYSLKQLGKEFSAHGPSSSSIHGCNQFPVLVAKTADEAWTVTVPWHWVQPLWSKLVHVNGVKTAGEKQQHQINFENGRPSYPYDFPFLPEGHKEHVAANMALVAARNKLPVSKQQPTKALEGYLSLGADWYFLRKWVFGLQLLEKTTKKAHGFGEFNDAKARVLSTPEDLAIVIDAMRDQEKARVPIAQYNKRDPVHELFVGGSYKPDVSKFPPLPVVQVHVSIRTKGTLRDHARIYESVENPTTENLIGFVTSGSFNLNQGQPTGIGLVCANFKAHTKVYVRNVGCSTFSNATLRVL